MAQCKGGSSILILPASSYDIGSSSGKKPKTPKKSIVGCGTPGTDDVCASIHDPRNFLVRGGHRAFDQKIMSLNKCTIQELRTANAVLAEEVVKARSGSDQVRDQLREKDTSIESLQATIERLEKARKLVDKKHLLQLKELNRRYKEEQSRRLALEAECAQLRASKEVVDQQVDAMQEERAQLMDLLNNQRSNNSRLEATVAADAATITELRSRLQTVESRFSDEVAVRQELFGRHKALEADLRLATERHTALTASQSEAESRMRAATSKVQLLEDELEAAKKALQAEKAAFSAERQRASSLKSDLTQLQTSAQLAAASAAADQAELERLRGQAEQLMTSNEGLRSEVARLREEVLHLTAQGVAAQASFQALQQQRDDMQQQLTSAQEAMERMEKSLREEAAVRLRAAQDEAAARQRGASEELAAKQRQWDGQLKTREKAWEDERSAMQRVHEEELTRKDLELLEVRERMREAQSSVAELAAEVSTFKFHGEHYAEVYKENEELKQRIAKADEVIAARDASLAEAAASHAAQLELWKAEANEVAQAAAKWKQRCTTLQAQLDAKDSESETSGQELRALTAKLSASEAERVKLQEALASTESKLTLVTQEANSYRSQLSEVLTSHHSASRQMETVQQDLQLRDLQLRKLDQSLNDEASRAAQLRQELAAAVAQHAKELEAKRRALDDLTDQLHEAERARATMQAEADHLRDKVALLTREVGRARLIADAASMRGGGGGGRGATSSSIRRSADGGEGWAYPHRAGGGGGGSAARQRPDSFDIDEEELDRRGPYGARGPPRGRREYDVVSLEEEAESWFRSLDEERRPREHPELGSSRRNASAGQRRAESQSEPRTLEVVARSLAPSPQPQVQPPALQLDNITADAAGPSGFRTYDVTISPKHGASADEPGGQQAAPQPLSLRPTPGAAAYTAAPTRSGSSGPISAGGAAAIAAAAYTAVVMPVEQGSGTYVAHAAATPLPPPPLQRAIPAAAASPSPATSAARYAPQRPQSSYRAYGIPAPHQQQQQPAYPYARSDAARSYGAMTPISPVMSESASNASSNLQERLQRLLGTGKLM